MCADITMCDDKACPDRGDCYRATATPTPHWQSYFATSPRDGTTCTYHWPMSDTINRNPKDAKREPMSNS